MSPKATVVGVRNRVGDAEGDFSKISPALLPEKKSQSFIFEKGCTWGNFFRVRESPLLPTGGPLLRFLIGILFMQGFLQNLFNIWNMTVVDSRRRIVTSEIGVYFMHKVLLEE